MDIDNKASKTFTLTGHSGPVRSVSTFIDAKTDKVYIVSGSDDKTIKVWDASEGTCLKTLTYHDWVYSVSTFPDANRKQKEQLFYNELIDYLSKDVINHFILPYAIPTTFNIVSGSNDKTVGMCSISTAVSTS